MAYDYTRDTIADIPARGALLYCDMPALGMAGGSAITYKELELQSRRAAARLMAMNVRTGDRVLILSENRPEWGIASFAVARAGAVAVPVLTDFSADQIRAIAEHSGATVAYASSKQEGKLAGLGLHVLAIKDLSRLPTADDSGVAFIQPEIRPSDLAAIVYTSGTTGAPKGVMLTHANYLSDALACRPVISLRTDDVALSILPLAHTYEYTIGFLIPMMSGASVRYLDRPPSSSVLLPALAAVRPTIVLSVPLVIEKIYRAAVQPGLERLTLYRSPMARRLLERLAGAKLRRSFGGRLRFFGIGGAPLDPEVERFLLSARFPFAIGYGLTETAPIIVAAAVGKTGPRLTGTALPGADIVIADAKQEDGGREVGELRVKGPMVFSGYYKDPARTADAFDQNGYFRTGDLASRDEGGRIRLRGRLKTMILGPTGENIYPEDVEAVLNSSPWVAESLVYGGEDGLAALIMLKPELVEELGACVVDGMKGAERAAARWGAVIGAAILSAEKSAEKAVVRVLDAVRRETNARLAGFSRLSRVYAQTEPFEKTPTQKIKRYLYPRSSQKEPEAQDASTVSA